MSRWRHSKTGRIYRVLMHGRLEATQEPVVIYAGEQEPGKVWVRPLAEWEAEVVIGGTPQPRFVLIEEQEVPSLAEPVRRRSRAAHDLQQEHQAWRKRRGLEPSFAYYLALAPVGDILLATGHVVGAEDLEGEDE